MNIINPGKIRKDNAVMSTQDKDKPKDKAK